MTKSGQCLGNDTISLINTMFADTNVLFVNYIVEDKILNFAAYKMQLNQYLYLYEIHYLRLSKFSNYGNFFDYYNLMRAVVNDKKSVIDTLILKKL